VTSYQLVPDLRRCFLLQAHAAQNAVLAEPIFDRSDGLLHFMLTFLLNGVAEKAEIHHSVV